MLIKMGFDVDCGCLFSEVSCHSLAALIILSSLSLKNRQDVSKLVAGNDPMPVVTRDLHVGMGKVSNDLSQKCGRDHSWDLTIRTVSSSALVWTLSLFNLLV